MEKNSPRRPDGAVWAGSPATASLPPANGAISRKDDTPSNYKYDAPSLDKIIVLAEHQQIFRQALIPYVRQATQKAEVIEAGSLNELLSIAASTRPVDLFLVDRGILGELGVTGLNRILALRPDAKLALFSDALNTGEIEQALDIGVAGYLSKSMQSGAFVSAVALLLNGERFLPSEFAVAALRYARARQRSDSGEDARHNSGLTQRQWAVLGEIVCGRSNREIAAQLGICEITVKVHLQSVFKKLKVTTRTQAATHAISRGWFGGSTAP